LSFIADQSADRKTGHVRTVVGALETFARSGLRGVRCEIQFYIFESGTETNYPLAEM